jgi:hypothetical protein
MSTSKVKMSTGGALVVLSLIVAAIVGWVMNLVAIIGHDFAAEIGMGIMRVIGVFIPIIGAVLGYI